MGLPRSLRLARHGSGPISADRHLEGRPVLVVGASGFLGGRLVERLVAEHGARVRVLVRRVMGAQRVARYPVEVVVGDLRDRAGVADAVRGCSVVFNCAKGKGRDALARREVDVEGAGHVVEAARAAAARVVHVSSMAVYDLPADGDVDESGPDAPRGDAYADNKLAGERRALEVGARLGVPVTVIQPTIVYGPYADVHGSEILEELRTSRMVLVDGGRGICNAVYVDDVVTAMLLAATSERGAGERFLISGPEYPTWAEFFGAFEAMLGVCRTESLTQAEAIELWRRSRRRPWLIADVARTVSRDPALRTRLAGTREGALARWVADRVLPGTFHEKLGRQRLKARQPPPEAPRHQDLPLNPVRPWVVRSLARRARVRIDKARELLGYDPVFTLKHGMALTEAWARWAGLVS